MKKILLLAFVISSSLAFAQEMKLPDDKKKKYAREEEKKAEISTPVRAVETERKEQSMKVEDKKSASTFVNYCIVRETAYPESKKVMIEVESDFSAMERGSDEDRVKLKESMSATTGIQYKTALHALNMLAVQGYRLSSTLTYQSGESIVKEYVMLKSDK